MVAASACRSSARAERHATVTVAVSVAGRVGPLRVDVSRRSAVVAFAGRPDAEQVGRSGDSERYDALGYDCGSNAGPQGIPLVKRRPRCRTVFFVEARTGIFGLFYTADPRYREAHGVRVGMPQRTAERLLGRRLHGGCGENIFLQSPRALLTVSFTGHTVDSKGQLVRGHVAELVLHGLHHNPGVFECV
jgi:hypothetical protein